MRIRLIARQTIEDYVDDNPQSRAAFKNWLTTIKFAEWKSPGDISSTFGTADLLGNSSERVVFNIGGNNYRLICKYQFGEKLIHLFVCWIGTYREYDELCSRRKQYTISDY